MSCRCFHILSSCSPFLHGVTFKLHVILYSRYKTPFQITFTVDWAQRKKNTPFQSCHFEMRQRRNIWFVNFIPIIIINEEKCWSGKNQKPRMKCWASARWISRWKFHCSGRRERSGKKKNYRKLTIRFLNEKKNNLI